MQARHRGSAGNGYRSGPVAGGSHTSEHRSFNRSASFGLPKPYQQQPRRGDVFMEAGRLAAEYLVSQGLLPANALPVMKWKSHASKNSRREGDLQGLRPQEAQEGRTSALARLGNFVPDAAASASGKRRFPVEYNSPGSRDQTRPRRRLGHSRSYDLNSSSSRVNGKRGPRALDMEADVDSAARNQEHQQATKELGRGMLKTYLPESTPRTDAGDSNSKSENNQFPEIMAPEIPTGADKDIPLVIEGDVSKMEDDDSGALDTEMGELIDDTTNDEVEKQCVTESLPVQLQHCAIEGDQNMNNSAGDHNMNNSADLQKLCRFVNVPTRTRSSLAHRFSKYESLSITKVDSTPDVKPQGSAESGLVELAVPSADKLTNPIQSSSCLDSDISRTLTVDSEEDIGKLSPAYPKDQDKCFESRSFPQGSMLHKQEGMLEPPGFRRSTSIAEGGDKQVSNHKQDGMLEPPGFGRSTSIAERGNKQVSNHMQDGMLEPPGFRRSTSIAERGNKKVSNHKQDGMLEPPGFGRSTSIAERGDKQVSNHIETGGETKKSGEWLPSIITQEKEYADLSNMREKDTSSQDKTNLHVDDTVAVADHDTSMDISLFPTGGNDLCLEYSEEKQHFQSLFKICDLNLMQASNINETRGNSDPNLIYPLNSETKREAASADIHLSENNRCNMSDEHFGPAADRKEIEIIDLENGSPQEDKVLSNSKIKEESVFTSVEGFPNNLPPSSGINDVHDGYSLMVSDFLGTDIADCSSVPPDFSSLHNEMGLHSGEVPALPQNMDIRDLFNINMSYMDPWDF